MDPIHTATPRAHLRGVLALVDMAARACGDRAELPALRALLDRPASLPDADAATSEGIKYDVYWAVDASTRRWGVTINDRHERDGFEREVKRFVASLGGRHALDLLEVARAGLTGAAPALTFAVGFDAPDAPPRLKFYLQEDRWGEGVASARDVRALAERIIPNLLWPEWLASERSVGVVTLELDAVGGAGLKLYLGARTAEGAATGAAPEVVALARTMAQGSPLAPAYHYLTVRLSARPPRHAINKIYEAVRLVDPRSDLRALDAWRDVAGLFRSAGREAALSDLRARLQEHDRLHVVPTATALEGNGDSADVYFTAWADDRVRAS